MRKQKFFLIFIILNSFLFVNEVQADKKQAAKKKSPAPEKSLPDFSKGFAKLAKFGLPNVKDAEYISIEMYSSAFPLHDAFGYQADLEGSAWLISEDKKSGTAKIVLNQGAVATVYDRQKLIEELTKKREAEAKKKKEKSDIAHVSLRYTLGDKLAGDWTKADLKKDAASITEYIHKQMREGYFWGRNSLGIWLLFAAHLNQKGLKKEANELAAVLFEAGKGKRIVILQALNALADAKYGVAYAVFNSDHDWKKYAANVADILNFYKKGWQNRPGVELLAEMLANREKILRNLKN